MPGHPGTTADKEGIMTTVSSGAATATRTARETQAEMFAAIQRGDSAALRALMHPEYVYTDVDGEEHSGADAGIEVAELFHTALPDMTIDLWAVHAPSDTLSIAEVRMRGTHTGPFGDIPASGGRIEGVGCNVIETQGGLIRRERDYYNELDFLRQAGAL